MLSVRAGQTMVILATLAFTPAFASRTHRAPTSGHSHSGKAKKPKLHGQRAIDSGRATEIQSALIRQHYLSGEPTGQWDAQTEAAMQKYQADHHWQTKIMPDSRALISLGLGPDHVSGALPTAQASAQPRASAPVAAEPESTRPAPNTLAAIHGSSD